MYNELLGKRFATKLFDKTKKISDIDIKKLEESIIYAPTSFGLQPFKILNITSPELREKLRPFAWDKNESQIMDSSNLFIFASLKKVSSEYINSYMQLLSQTRNIPIETLEGYKNMQINYFANRSPEEVKMWASEQAHIAIGFLIMTASELGIDECAIGGFSIDEFDKVLGLDKTDYGCCLVMALGYRSAEDTYPNLPKVRKSRQDLFEDFV